MAETKATKNEVNLVPVSGSNSGTAGGSTNVMVVGNLVICWGTTGTITANTGSTVKTIVYPVTFGSIPTVTAMPRENTVSGVMIVYQEAASPSTTGVSLTINNTGSNGTAKLDWIAIGTL